MATLDLDAFPPGKRMRVLRAAADLTLRQVMARTGIHEGRLSEIENGKRVGSPDYWARLAKVFEGAGFEPPS